MGLTLTEGQRETFREGSSAETTFRDIFRDSLAAGARAEAYASAEASAEGSAVLGSAAGDASADAGARAAADGSLGLDRDRSRGGVGSTGYDWSAAGSRAYREEEAVEVGADVPPGCSLQVQQAVASCGPNAAWSELFRFVHVDWRGNVRRVGYSGRVENGPGAAARAGGDGADFSCE